MTLLAELDQAIADGQASPVLLTRLRPTVQLWEAGHIHASRALAELAVVRDRLHEVECGCGEPDFDCRQRWGPGVSEAVDAARADAERFARERAAARRAEVLARRGQVQRRKKRRKK